MMRLARPAAAPAAENILPMINVVFLLLIFFMLAGALRVADPFEIVPPAAHGGEPADAGLVELLIDRDGRAWLDGAPAADAEIAAAIARERRGDLRIKADGRAEAARIVAIMELLRRAGVERLTLLTLEAAP
jgi:biopolymer transport protein ExbD